MLEKWEFWNGYYGNTNDFLFWNSPHLPTFWLNNIFVSNLVTMVFSQTWNVCFEFTFKSIKEETEE